MLCNYLQGHTFSCVQVRENEMLDKNIKADKSDRKGKNLTRCNVFSFWLNVLMIRKLHSLLQAIHPMVFSSKYADSFLFM